MPWRTEDDRLCVELENELAIEALWRAETHGAAALPHPRAAGLVAWLRRTPVGEAAVAALLSELCTGERAADTAAVCALTRPASLHGLAPELLHQLAVFHEHVAAALATAAPAAAIVLHGRALAAWFALGYERSYLEALARAVLGPRAKAEELVLAVDEAMTQPLVDLGRRARRAAKALGADGATALRTLAEAPTACRIAGVGEALTRRLVIHAERERSRAIEEALAPIGTALTAAKAQGRAEREGPGLIGRVVAVWQWSDRDEHVERYAVDEFTPIAWNVYREPGVEPIRRLLGPLEPLLDRLAYRIDGDPTRIAYAARCATMFVFRSEMAPNAEEQRRLAERGYALCPSHANARLVLANSLCSEAKRRLERGALPEAEHRAIKALIERAAELNPDARQLPGLRERLARTSFWGAK